MEILQALSSSLLSPMVLAFALGLFATLVKSDLKFPDELYTALTIYLLFAIGLKGGMKLDGMSLVPTLRAGTATGAPSPRATGGGPSGRSGTQTDRVLFVHSQRIDIPVKWRKSAVMTERFRLINGEELYDIQADPGQAVDIASKHPDAVKDLRASYDKWWASLTPVFGDVVRIGIGAEQGDPSVLTSHDWRTSDETQVVWNANQVNSAHAGNGYWAIDVVRAGTYEVELRRWPRPSRLGIDAQRARLKIGDVEAEKVTSPFDPDAKFRVKLNAGPTTLQSWLTTREGKSRGAYFVYVRRLE